MCKNVYHTVTNIVIPDECNLYKLKTMHIIKVGIRLTDRLMIHGIAGQ